MKSTLNGPSLQHYITKILRKNINACQSWNLMKANITGKGLSFQYWLRRLISLKRTTLTWQWMCCSATRKVRRKISMQSAGQGVTWSVKSRLTYWWQWMVSRHYTAINNIARLLSRLNGKTQHAFHYCMNCLNGFRTGWTRDKHYEYCSSNGHVKVNMPTEKGKWL